MSFYEAPDGILYFSNKSEHKEALDSSKAGGWINAECSWIGEIMSHIVM